MPNDIIMERRPLEVSLSPIVQSLSNVMNNVGTELSSNWSFCGGFPRDLYLNKNWNDYDICIFGVSSAREMLSSWDLISKTPQFDSEIPHDYFIDPYDFSQHEYPIHWINAENHWAYAPSSFDFTINQICLKPDGYFYAPTQTWNDLDNGIVRKLKATSTVNLMMRAIRFASKYNFRIEDSLLEEFNNIIKNPMDTLSLIRNVGKMLKDGLEVESFNMMKSLSFPDLDGCKDIHDYAKFLDGLIISGKGYREPAPPRYNF